MPLDLHDIEANRRFRNFNWEKTRSFYIIAKMGSFSNAATFLHISQSGLSRQITELEKALETPLFIRVARGVKLTRKGEELFSIVEANFLNMKGFTHNIHAETKQSKKRKIRISTTQPIAAYILNQYILQYNEENSDILFEIIVDDELIDIVINDVDFAIRPLDKSTKDIRQDHIFTLKKRLYASPKYLTKYGTPQTLAELRNHHILVQSSPESHPYSDINWILRLGMPHGEMHEPVFKSNSFECLMDAASQGTGIISCYEQMKIVKDLNLINILEEVEGDPIRCYLHYPSFLEKDIQLDTFKKYLLEKLAI